MYLPAPHGILCEFMRETWDKSLICKSSELPPEMNINGLYWRLTGIGRQELERMNPKQRALIEHSGSF
jgi:hypothetical protein